MSHKKTISISILVLIFYFIGRLVHREWSRISSYDWSPQPGWFVLSILVLFIVYILAGYGWKLVLRTIGEEIGWNRGLYITLISMYGRYLPGGVWPSLSKLYLCKLEGIPESRSGVGVLLEQAYPIACGGLVFAASLLFWDDASVVLRTIPLIVVFPVFFAFLHPKPLLKVMNPVLGWLGKEPVHISFPLRNMLILAGYYCLYWVVSGIAFFFFVNSFYPLNLQYMTIMGGIYAIAFVAGYVALFAPAGLGVREGVLTILLSLFIPASAAVGIALLSRLWLVGVELLLALLFMANTDTRKIARNALGW